MAETLKLAIRRLDAEDLDAVCKIEEEVFVEPRTRDEFAGLACCTQRVGLVVLLGIRVVAFAVVQLSAEKVDLSRFAVMRKYRRRGIGGWLLKVMQAYLEKCWAPRVQITTDAHDTNLPAQLFLKAVNWKACGIWQDERGETFYRFRWLSPRAEAVE